MASAIFFIFGGFYEQKANAVASLRIKDHFQTLQLAKANKITRRQVANIVENNICT